MDNNRYQQHSNDNRYQLQSDGLSAQKPNRMNKQSLTKTHTNERQQTSISNKSFPIICSYHSSYRFSYKTSIVK